MKPYMKLETAIKYAGIYNIRDERFDNFREDEKFLNEAIKHNGDNLAWAPYKLRNNKEFVLEAVKHHGWAIRHASPEIQELCKDRNPKETLEKAIAYEKLKTQLKPKTDEKPTQKLKI